MQLNKLLIKKPLISEKGTDLANMDKYVFLVDPKTNKKQAKELIESIYKVNVIKVNVIRVRKKTDTYKKVIVTLQRGQTIDTIPH